MRLSIRALCASLSSVVLLACATGEGEGEESATPTTGDPVTTSPTFTSDPTLSTTDEPPGTSSTSEPADSSTTMAAGDVPLECPPGEMDCPCDAKGGCTPPLVCTRDTCVVPMCDEDLNEPNNFRVDAIELGMISDDDTETLEFEGVLDNIADDDPDEDWYQYLGSDGVGDTVAPGLVLTVDDGSVEVCQYFACNNGDPQVVCPEGTMGVTDGSVNGCCGTTGFEFGPDDVECIAGAFDTSGTVWIVVRNASLACIGYSGVAHF